MLTQNGQYFKRENFSSSLFADNSTSSCLSKLYANTAVKIVANEYKDVITEEAYNLLMEWEAERFPD